MIRFQKKLNAENQVCTNYIRKLIDDIISDIPINLDNRDYQEYLAWVSEGNVIEDAPLPPPPEIIVTPEEPQ